MTGFAPDFDGAEIRVSPNFGPRRDGATPTMIILHYTGMASDIAAESWLCDPASEVSSHYLVHQDGRVVQMVREADRAWHAGRSSWHGVRDINSWSIGIEIANPGIAAGNPPFPEPQIEAVIALCRDIATRHGIVAEMILAHSDVAPGRKVDPGPNFPWRRLADAGVGAIPVARASCVEGPLSLDDEGDRVEKLQSMLQLAGYGLDVTGKFDEATRAVVEAFQLHYRAARPDGVADRETLELITGMVAPRCVAVA